MREQTKQMFKLYAAAYLAGIIGCEAMIAGMQNGWSAESSFWVMVVLVVLILRILIWQIFDTDNKKEEQK